MKDDKRIAPAIITSDRDTINISFGEILTFAIFSKAIATKGKATAKASTEATLTPPTILNANPIATIPTAINNNNLTPSPIDFF